MNQKKNKAGNTSIAANRKAGHDYFIEERIETGLVLEGWEVKSLRAGHVQLKESYIVLKKEEAWLVGSHITPLKTASTHINPDPTRSRKLLLHQKEIVRLIGTIQRQGYTLVPLSLYWKQNRVKLEIGLARGKKQHDKRATEKERDWQRDKQRLIKRA